MIGSGRALPPFPTATKPTIPHPILRIKSFGKPREQHRCTLMRRNIERHSGLGRMKAPSVAGNRRRAFASVGNGRPASRPTPRGTLLSGNSLRRSTGRNGFLTACVAPERQDQADRDRLPVQDHADPRPQRDQEVRPEILSRIAGWKAWRSILVQSWHARPDGETCAQFWRRLWAQYGRCQTIPLYKLGLEAQPPDRPRKRATTERPTIRPNSKAA
ncbi:hypothetical protein ACVINW_000569 [Bradyrhizobium sp. USDA 4461]